MNKKCNEILAKLQKENKIIMNNFTFPLKQELKLRLKDMLELNVEEKYYLSEKMINYVLDMNDVQKGTKWEGRANNGSLNKDIALTIGVRSAEAQRGGVTNFIVDGMKEEIKVKDLKEKFVASKYNEFIKENNYVPEMFNPYNKAEIKDIAPTQSTQCGSTTSSATTLINQNYKIRKLTPKECFRLMGFDDSDYEKANQVNSNAQLYKQTGNSIVVQVLEEIFRELLGVDNSCPHTRDFSRELGHA